MEGAIPFSLRPDGTIGGVAPGGDGHDASEVLDILLGRPAWMAHALCREHPEVNWFPESGESAEPAIALCRRCPVREPCSEFAMGERFGVWAGTSARERQRTRRVVRSTTLEARPADAARE